MEDLDLSETLTSMKVPREDIPTIVTNTLGTNTHPDYPKVVKLLESLY